MSMVRGSMPRSAVATSLSFNVQTMRISPEVTAIVRDETGFVPATRPPSRHASMPARSPARRAGTCWPQRETVARRAVHGRRRAPRQAREERRARYAQQPQESPAPIATFHLSTGVPRLLCTQAIRLRDYTFLIHIKGRPCVTPRHL